MIKSKKFRFEIVLFAVLMIFIAVKVNAADPGHGAAVIGSGTFEAGNYVYPRDLSILGNFSIGSNVFYVNNNTGNVVIGTAKKADDE